MEAADWGGGRVRLGLRFLGGKVRIQPRQGGIEVKMEDGEWSREGDTGAGLALAPTRKNGYYSFCREGNGGKGAETAVTIVATQCNEEGKYAKKNWVMGERRG